MPGLRATGCYNRRPKRIAKRAAPPPSALHVRAARLRSVALCGSGAVVAYSASRNQVVVMPALCRSWQCPRCSVVKRAQWADLVVRGKPDRFITLTCDPALFHSPADALQQMRKAWSRLVQKIRKQYGAFEFVRVWELHKSGYPHIHAAVRSKYIPQDWLSQTWQALGVGKVVDIRKVHNPKYSARYVAKYLGKTVGDMARMLQGTRIITKSRNWAPPEPEDSPAEDLKDWRQAHTKADLWMLLADLASCGCTTISQSTYTLRTVLDCSDMRIEPRLTSLDCIPWRVFETDADPPPT